MSKIEDESEGMMADRTAAAATTPSTYAKEETYYDSSSPSNEHHTQFLDLTNGEGGDRFEETVTVDPNTPGKVVEAGQEHTGRWTKEEHEAFLKALQMYGKEWKKVAAKVKTRTVVQTRTHAQKYFQKLQKAMDTSEDVVTQVDMGVAMPPVKKKKVKAARQSSVTSAAHVISNLSAPSASKLPAPHGFSSEPFRPAAASSAPQSSFSSMFKGWKSNTMKIIAPEPDARNFPEPSPAACGKRKLAEIAAARMLAGVAAGSSKPLLSSALEDGDATPPEVAAPAKAPALPLTTKLQIVNPETWGEPRKRKHEGGSPVTPWDGQLEELIKNNKQETNPVVGPIEGRTRLHKAVCDMDMGALQVELQENAQLDKKDDAGFLPIHTACSLCLLGENAAIAISIVRMLLEAGGDAASLDNKGNTPLHWAARAGDKEIAQLLLVKSCPPDAKNQEGETPLHWGARAGRTGIGVVGVLLENGARPSLLNNEFKRPIDVAGDGFEGEGATIRQISEKKRLSKEEKRLLQEALEVRRDVRANLLIASTQSRTLVLHHPECLEHIPKSESDWECPGRVTSILRRVLPVLDSTGVAETSGIFPHEVTVSEEFDRAKIDLLSRVHSADYLAFVSELSKDLERQQKEAEANTAKDESGSEKGESARTVVPFTPMVQRSMIKINEANVKQGSHSDTSFSVGSLRAARRAAGAVQHAVDCVLVGRNRNAFCVVRPPGHHAGVNGLLDGGESCGFCIFNNVAAGAMHAISDERLLCERCAIVDIDVHHGNGTEEIVKKCNDPGKLFFFSIHLYDNDKRKRSGANAQSYKFYPGTGSEDDVAFNIINVPITPLWKEIQNATPMNTHNTRQKARLKSSTNSQDSIESSSEAGTPRDAPRDDAESDVASAKAGSSPKPSPKGARSGRLAYRQAIQDRLLPALRAFNPDLILISAGFDAAKGDVGNAKHEQGGRERMGLDLEPEDYAWTTRKVLEIADICCQGRVVSVLEGGYGRTPTGETRSLDKTAFSECAVRHLHAMIDPYDAEKRFWPRKDL